MKFEEAYEINIRIFLRIICLIPRLVKGYTSTTVTDHISTFYQNINKNIYKLLKDFL